LEIPDNDDAPPYIQEDPDEDLDVGDDEDVLVTSPQSLKDLTPATVFYILHDQFDTEPWWEWEGEAIFSVLGEVLQKPLGPADEDMVQAIQTLRNDEPFWTEWEIFNIVTQGLDGRVVSFQGYPSLQPIEMQVAMDTARLVINVEEAHADYSEEVVSYIAVNCIEHGHWALPPPLHIAQERVVDLFHIQGWETPMYETVRTNEAEGSPVDLETERGLQVQLYRFLKEYRLSWRRRASREIDAYIKGRKA
jgi:hypothetical protein